MEEKKIKYGRYIDFVIARYLIERGYDNSTIVKILYER